MLTIVIEEEYGYRHWRWDYPGTEASLRADWKAQKAPLNFFDPSDGDFRGTMARLDIEDYCELKDTLCSDGRLIRMHVHTDDDSYLYIGDEYVDSAWQRRAQHAVKLEIERALREFEANRLDNLPKGD